MTNDVSGIICLASNVVLFDPQMHTYVLCMSYSSFNLTPPCPVHGQEQRVTILTEVKGALTISSETINAIPSVKPCICTLLHLHPVTHLVLHKGGLGMYPITATLQQPICNCHNP